MREICLSGSMSGNRKQNQAKPDCGGAAKAKPIIHRETTVTAPVLDSTRHFTHRRSSDRNRCTGNNNPRLRRARTWRTNCWRRRTACWRSRRSAALPGGRRKRAAQHRVKRRSRMAFSLRKERDRQGRLASQNGHGTPRGDGVFIAPSLNATSAGEENLGVNGKCQFAANALSWGPR